MTTVLTALGVILMIEGGLYALFPDAMKKAMLVLLAQPAEQLRLAGLAAATFGVGVLWLLHRLPG